jgi:CheY-like chemotaxis protein
LLAIGRDSPDLLVSDLRMPGMDGFQMMRALTGSPFRDGMEIVVVTGLDAVEIAREGGLPPDIRVFHKPVSFGELRAIAEDLLARRAALVVATRSAA